MSREKQNGGMKKFNVDFTINCEVEADDKHAAIQEVYDCFFEGHLDSDEFQIKDMNYKVTEVKTDE